jgi:hypothetical protein
MSLSGALRFGRYAFPPNRLGYCGPADHEALLEYVSTGQADQGLVELEKRFEGAYPYLVLIAQANGIADPFDDRVVEAYWVGNDCLRRVGTKPLYELLESRFRTKMTRNDFDWLSGKLGHGARPHHNFHVFDIYIRAGLMRSDKSEVVLGAMDSCRISWATVSAIAGDDLVVERQPLGLLDGKLCLGAPRATRVTYQTNTLGLAKDVKPGDHVSVHWDWACEVLEPVALARLQALTDRYVTLANETI